MGFYAISSWKDRIQVSCVFTSVEFALTPGGTASRNDPDDFARCTFAMADKKESGAYAHAKQQEPFFSGRVFIVEELNSKSS
jgi:hypothetical protein